MDYVEREGEQVTDVNVYEMDRAASYPSSYRRVMTTKDYRTLMVSTNGELMAVGKMWHWVGKSLGAGLYEVTLKEFHR